jgi:uncharacterized cupredoxin-like copper-binding protein
MGLGPHGALIASAAVTNRKLTTILILGLVVFAACNKAAEAPGEAGDPAAVDEVVEISTTDKLRFVPSTIEVQAGETIEFRVSNVAKGEHEFVLGPVHEHGEGMMHDDSSSTGPIEPGSEASVFWTFPEAGEVEFACYIAGHNEQGMTGTITVTG